MLAAGRAVVRAPQSRARGSGRTAGVAGRVPAVSLGNAGLAGQLGSSRLPMCPSATLPKLAAPSGERDSGHLPSGACAREIENWIFCLIHLYCNDVYNLVVFHYLIFKKPILLVFYMKKILKLNLCCIFPEMLCVR